MTRAVPSGHRACLADPGRAPPPVSSTGLGGSLGLDAADNFSTLFEMLPIGAYRSSPEGRNLRANAALVRLNGYRSEAEMLHGVNDIAQEWYVEPGRRAQFQALLERDGVVRDFVSEIHRHKTRERCWIAENALLVRDGSGQVRYYEGTVEDITERALAQQALERSERQFRQLADQMPGMVFRVRFAPDGARRYLFVGQGVRDLYGVSPEAVMADATLLDAFRHPDDRAQLEAALQSNLRLRHPRASTFRVVLADGQLKWLELAATTVGEDLDGIERVGVIVDITERKQADALRQERDRAALANQAKSQLLSRVSHELRTPLNAVLGFSQLIASDTQGSPRHRDWAAQIVSSGRHLLGLVDDLLDLSSLDTGQLSLGLCAIDLAPLLAETWAMVAAALPQPTVAFDNQVGAPLWVRADPRRMKQVLANLLSNAIKYNHAGGQVSVRARAEAGQAVLAIADSGRGMDAAQLERLFRPFDRLGAEHSRIEGRGIGLALAQQLVEAMGGALAVDSTPGVGSTFSVWLPVAEPPGVTTAVEPPNVVTAAEPPVPLNPAAPP